MLILHERKCVYSANLFLGLLLSYRNQNLLQMRNKVDIRAFCVEQVIKMKFVGDCDTAKVVQESKVLESYIIGDASMPEFINESSELMKLIADMKETLKNQLEKEYHLPTYEEVMKKFGNEAKEPTGINDVFCYGLKPNEA